MLSPCHLKGSIIVFFLPTGIYRSMAADLNSGYTSAKANSQGEIKIQRINGVVKSFAFQYFTYCFILHPTGYRSTKWFSSKIRCLILKIDVKGTRPPKRYVRWEHTVEHLDGKDGWPLRTNVVTWNVRQNCDKYVDLLWHYDKSQLDTKF